MIDESHSLAGLLASAYGSRGDEPEVTSFHGDFEGTVDYILHTAQLRVLSTMPTPSRAELRKRRSLPDWRMPSDHVPIVCDLEWCTHQYQSQEEDGGVFEDGFRGE